MRMIYDDALRQCFTTVLYDDGASRGCFTMMLYYDALPRCFTTFTGRFYDIDLEPRMILRQIWPE